jgi:hypothetical protein
VRQGERGQTAAAAATRQTGGQQQAASAALLILVIVHIFIVVAQPVRQTKGGQAAAPAHAAGEQNLGQVAFIAIAVQTITDRFTFRHSGFLHELHARERASDIDAEISDSAHLPFFVLGRVLNARGTQ